MNMAKGYGPGPSGPGRGKGRGPGGGKGTAPDHGKSDGWNPFGSSSQRRRKPGTKMCPKCKGSGRVSSGKGKPPPPNKAKPPSTRGNTRRPSPKRKATYKV